MKKFLLTAYGFIAFSAISFAQNPSNTSVQGGGSMSGNNSGAAATAQGSATSQENRIKKSNSKNVDSVSKSQVNNKSTNATTPAVQLPAADRSKQYTDALKQVLKLNEDQYGKLKAVNTDFIKQIDKLTQTSKDNVSFQQGIMEADRGRVDKYRTILNPKQLKMYTDNPQLSGLSGNNEAVRTDNGKPETGNSTQSTDVKGNSSSVNPKTGTSVANPKSSPPSVNTSPKGNSPEK